MSTSPVCEKTGNSLSVADEDESWCDRDERCRREVEVRDATEGGRRGTTCFGGSMCDTMNNDCSCLCRHSPGLVYHEGKQSLQRVSSTTTRTRNHAVRLCIAPCGHEPPRRRRPGAHQSHGSAMFCVQLISEQQPPTCCLCLYTNSNCIPKGHLV